jgi:hypothetical protein
MAQKTPVPHSHRIGSPRPERGRPAAISAVQRVLRFYGAPGHTGERGKAQTRKQRVSENLDTLSCGGCALANICPRHTPVPLKWEIAMSDRTRRKRRDAGEVSRLFGSSSSRFNGAPQHRGSGTSKSRKLPSSTTKAKRTCARAKLNLDVKIILNGPFWVLCAYGLYRLFA